VIRPPHTMGAFEFAVVAALRAAQLARGCRPRVDGDHTNVVLARREVAEGKVTPTVNATDEIAASRFPEPGRRLGASPHQSTFREGR
jgi:DNA-directed RNA polymerase subunit K/omega